MLVQIAVDLLNPSEVLGAQGILALDFMLDKQITSSRFVGAPATKCADGEIRSAVFEVECADFNQFLNRVAALGLSLDDDKVIVSSDGKEVVTLDWWQAVYLGDSGNFSKVNPLDFVNTHHTAMKAMLSIDARQLLATTVDMHETNYLASYSVLKQNYQDAGHTYESEDVFYASEFFLLIGLQAFRAVVGNPMAAPYQLRYSVHREFLPTQAAFAAAAGAHTYSRTFQSWTRSFGKGKVLRVATEVPSK